MIYSLALRISRWLLEHTIVKPQYDDRNLLLTQEALIISLNRCTTYQQFVVTERTAIQLMSRYEPERVKALCYPLRSKLQGMRAYFDLKENNNQAG